MSNRLTIAAASDMSPPEDPQREDAPHEALTMRQREVLQLIAESLSANEIAHCLGVSAKTIEAHRNQVMSRLGIRDGPSLVSYARRHGLVATDLSRS